LLPAVLFGYTLLFQLSVLIGARAYYGSPSEHGIGLSAATLAPRGWADPTTVGAYLVGLAAFFGAYGLPAALARRSLGLPGSGNGHPLSRAITPYIVRLCLFETCSLAGFVLAFVSGSFLPMVPFAMLGIIGTLGSPPTAGFLVRIGGQT
jgi:hypothetical protein